MDLWVVTLPDGALNAEAAADKAMVSTLKNVDLNLVVLPSEFLHTLQVGVIVELKAREQCALSMISEYKVNNEQIFVEKTSALEAWKKVQAHNEKTVAVMAKAFRTVPELHHPKGSVDGCQD